MCISVTSMNNNERECIHNNEDLDEYQSHSVNANTSSKSYSTARRRRCSRSENNSRAPSAARVGTMLVYSKNFSTIAPSGWSALGEL